jgi:calcineurin-like phosphoesterase family protein
MQSVRFTKPFYLISDTHFWHSRLAFEFGLRTQFNSIEEMNKTIFENWNNTIGEDDYIFFLGDFVCGSNVHGFDKYKTAQIIYDNLQGKKILIKGNHDENLKKYTKIPVIEESLEIIYKDKRIILSHAPIEVFKQDISIHGHVHNNLTFHHKPNCFNVSCEVVNFTPVHIDDILKEFMQI